MFVMLALTMARPMARSRGVSLSRRPLWSGRGAKAERASGLQPRPPNLDAAGVYRHHAAARTTFEKGSVDVVTNGAFRPGTPDTHARCRRDYALTPSIAHFKMRAVAKPAPTNVHITQACPFGDFVEMISACDTSERPNVH
jgi:hypothetical protein